MKKKATIAVVVLVLVLCCAMGGTLAWLVDTPYAVTNTFTYGDINIDLSESKDLDLKMIPGNDIKKDPKVTVEANSEACWLFVKVEESDNFDYFMEYSIATGWIALNDANADGVADDGIYYQTVEATTVNTDFAVLANDSVSVNKNVTKEMLNADDFVNPTLTFTAYAVQRDNNITTAAQAWEIANSPTAD